MQPNGPYPQHGQQVYGGPQPYGVPQGGSYGYGPQQPGGPGHPTVVPPTPPKRDRAVRVLIILTALVVLVAGGATVLVLTSEDDKPAERAALPAPTRYKLVLPKKIFEGKYDLLRSSKTPPAGDGPWHPAELGDRKSVSGDYTDREEIADDLSVSGLYGDIKRPERVREALMRGAANGDGTVRAVAARTFRFHPDEVAEAEVEGSPVPVMCEVLIKTEERDGSRWLLTVCAWADKSTAAVMTEYSPSPFVEAPEDIDLEGVALETLDLRNELRKPVD